jgi:hypothetical protein
MQRQIVIFAGADALARAGVWETNGTAAGTHELNGIRPRLRCEPVR